MKFKHREHVITVRRDGTFMAEGGNITGRSLEAVRRKLDEKYNAKPFEAIRLPWFRDKAPEVVTVVGMRRRERWGRAFTEFVLKDGNTARDLYKKTPQNMRLLRAAIALKRKHQTIRSKHERLEAEALRKCELVKSE